MVIYLSLLVAVIGALLYALSSNAKLQEIGRISFGCGLLAWLLKVGEPLIGLLGGGR